MVTSSNGNIFRVTGLLCGEFTGHRWIPHTKASDAELWYFFYLRVNSWANNENAGDSRRYRAHYDVIVMKWGIGGGRRGVVVNKDMHEDDQYLCSTVM